MELIMFGIIVCLVVAYIPLVLIVTHRDRLITMRRRPINEILRDAYASGRISEEEWSAKMDEVHRAMPSLDAEYPRVREFTETSVGNKR
jgi:uncharacterized membrane protein